MIATVRSIRNGLSSNKYINLSDNSTVPNDLIKYCLKYLCTKLGNVEKIFTDIKQDNIEELIVETKKKQVKSKKKADLVLTKQTDFTDLSRFKELLDNNNVLLLCPFKFLSSQRFGIILNKIPPKSVHVILTKVTINSTTLDNYCCIYWDKVKTNKTEIEFIDINELRKADYIPDIKNKFNENRKVIDAINRGFELIISNDNKRMVCRDCDKTYSIHQQGWMLDIGYLHITKSTQKYCLNH